MFFIIMEDNNYKSKIVGFYVLLNDDNDIQNTKIINGMFDAYNKKEEKINRKDMVYLWKMGDEIKSALDIDSRQSGINLEDLVKLIETNKGNVELSEDENRLFSASEAIYFGKKVGMVYVGQIGNQADKIIKAFGKDVVFIKNYSKS